MTTLSVPVVGTPVVWVPDGRVVGGASYNDPLPATIIRVGADPYMADLVVTPGGKDTFTVSGCIYDSSGQTPNSYYMVY